MQCVIEDKAPSRISVWLKTDEDKHLGLVDFWLSGDGQITIAGNPQVLVRKIRRGKRKEFDNIIADIRVRSPP